MNTEDAKIAIFEFDNETIAEAYENDEPHDIISESADSNVDIHTYDLLMWLPDNYSYVEDGIYEFGFPTGSDGKPDMIRAIMQGQYQQNTESLWEAWEEIKSDIQDYLAENKVEEEDTENIIKAIELLRDNN